MRIVHLITRLILGGAQENTLYNCEDLQNLFCDLVTLVTGPAEGPEGDLFARAESQGLDVRVIPELRRAIDPRADWTAYRRIVSWLRELRPDVVHTHSSKAGILGRAAAFRLGVPAIVHTIHGLPFHPYEKWWKNLVYIHAERWAARRCDRILTVANAMIDQAVAARIAPREFFTTIYSGMEVEPFLAPPRPPEVVRDEVGLPRDALVVGKVARLFEFKGHDDVIDAAESLCRRRPELHFLFVGGGIWRDRLESKIRARRLTDRFHFTGLVPSSRIPELLHAVDLVVHASYREGLARVLPQALIAGKPVVSYDVDGAREVVVPHQTGCLVPPGDVAGLASAIESLLENAARRREYGATGRARFTELFRHETMTRRIRAEYEAILERKRHATRRPKDISPATPKL